MKFSNSRSLLSTPWAIHAGHANELLEKFLSSSQIGLQFSPKEDESLISLYDIKNDCSIVLKIEEGESYTEKLSSVLASSSSSEQGFVATINVTGALMKYGDMCSYGMDEMAEMVNMLKSDSSVIGLISLIDSPGGQVYGITNLSNSVKNFGKPTIALVNDGIAASGAYWYATSHQKVYLASAICEVGSIGVFCTLYDNEKRLEDMGVKRISVYSRLSPAKNQAYIQAIEGKPELMQDNLDEIAKLFHNHVSSNRTITDPEIYDGAMYLAEAAISKGMADGIKSLSEAVDEIRSMHQASSTQTNQTKIKKDMNIQEFENVKGIAAENITPEQITAINAKLKAEGIEGVEIVTAGTVENLNQQIVAAKEKGEDNTDKINVADFKNQIKALTDIIAKIESPAVETKPKGDDNPPGAKKEFVPSINSQS